MVCWQTHVMCPSNDLHRMATTSSLLAQKHSDSHIFCRIYAFAALLALLKHSLICSTFQYNIEQPTSVYFYLNLCVLKVSCFIFINIIRIVICKLRAQSMSCTDFRCTLTKAVLALFALFGLHYVIFLIFNIRLTKHPDLWTKIMVAFNEILGSFQVSYFSARVCE